MVIEKNYLYRPAQESENSKANMLQLTSDFPEIFEDSITSAITHIKHENLFAYVEGDHYRISYSSHEASTRNTLIFNFYDNYFENKFKKELEFNTLLDISSGDGRHKVIIKDGLSLSLVDMSKELMLCLEVGHEEGVLREAISLNPTEENGSYFVCTENIWDISPSNRSLIEIFNEGLGYYINRLEITYEASEAQLSLVMGLE